MSKNKQVNFLADEVLLLQFDTIVGNRSKTLRNFIEMIVHASNKETFLKTKIDKLDTEKEILMREYDYEMGLKEKNLENERKEIDNITKAVETVCNIITGTGVIGQDKLDDIGLLNGVNIVDLKEAIPIHLHDKFVRFHPQFNEKPGRLI